MNPVPHVSTRALAEWAASVTFADIPPRIVRIARAQAASVFASSHAALETEDAHQVLTALRKHAPAGNSPVLATGETFHLDSALLANCALGMALDYDDYLFMGHTGHSAVWTAWLVGLQTGASVDEILTAQIVANEIGGRIGAACILGPQNGQLWSHIHLAGAALAAGRLFHLNAEQMTHALGIAFAQPNYGLFPGFMGPGSKLLTAATPTLTGLHAARFAEAGLTGNTAILEDGKGFLRHFSYRPIPSMLSGLGRAWLTDTLAIKPYPGCAYIDTAIDTVLRMRERILADRGGFDAEAVESIRIDASLLTTEMNRLSTEHLDEDNLLPVNINFNIPINVALALLEGELTARVLSDEHLRRRRDVLVPLSRKVDLHHEWSHTLALLDDLHATLGVQRFFHGFTRSEARWVAARAKRDLGHNAFEAGEIGRLLKAVLRDRPAFLRTLLPGRKRGAASVTLDDADFSRVRLPFAARVTVRFQDGATYTDESRLPRGAAANGDLEAVAQEKLLRELTFTCGTEQAGRAWDLLANAERYGARAVLAGLTVPLANEAGRPVN